MNIDRRLESALLRLKDDLGRDLSVIYLPNWSSCRPIAHILSASGRWKGIL